MDAARNTRIFPATAVARQQDRLGSAVALRCRRWICYELERGPLIPAARCTVLTRNSTSSIFTRAAVILCLHSYFIAVGRRAYAVESGSLSCGPSANFTPLYSTPNDRP